MTYENRSFEWRVHLIGTDVWMPTGSTEVIHFDSGSMKWEVKDYAALSSALMLQDQKGVLEGAEAINYLNKRFGHK